MARILNMNIFKRLWDRLHPPAVRSTPARPATPVAKPKPKRQRYSGIKTRVYEDKPARYHHVSRPLAWSPELNRYVYATAKGITYRRAK